MASVDVNKNKFLEGQNPTLMKEFGVFFEKLSNKYQTNTLRVFRMIPIFSN